MNYQNKETENLITKILPVLRVHNTLKAGLFGSYARGEFRQDSDVDILISLQKEKSLFDFIKIKLDLEDVLNKKVDLVEYNTIKPALKDSILNSEIKIL